MDKKTSESAILCVISSRNPLNYEDYRLFTRRFMKRNEVIVLVNSYINKKMCLGIVYIDNNMH